MKREYISIHKLITDCNVPTFEASDSRALPVLLDNDNELWSYNQYLLDAESLIFSLGDDFKDTDLSHFKEVVFDELPCTLDVIKQQLQKIVHLEPV
jgi:hypothetical protein